MCTPHTSDTIHLFVPRPLPSGDQEPGFGQVAPINLHKCDDRGLLAERQDAPQRHRPSVGGFRLSGGLPRLHLPHPVRHERRAGGRLGGGRDLVHPVSARPEPLHIHAEHEHQRHSDRLLRLLPRPLRRAGGLPLQERDLLHPTLIPRCQCLNLPLCSV